jgi:hypothetical protein
MALKTNTAIQTNEILFHARFMVLTVVFQMIVFWDVILCQWISGSPHFEGLYV